MEKKWGPCFCTILLGIAIIVFTWLSVTWGQIALTICGVLVIIKGIANSCCCQPKKKESGGSSSCCS